MQIIIHSLKLKEKIIKGQETALAIDSSAIDSTSATVALLV